MQVSVTKESDATYTINESQGREDERMCLRNLFGDFDCTWILFIIILILLVDNDCGEDRGRGCGCGCC